MYRDGKDVEHIGIYWNLGREIREMYLEALRLGWTRGFVGIRALQSAGSPQGWALEWHFFIHVPSLSMILYRQSKAVYLGFLTFSQAGSSWAHSWFPRTWMAAIKQNISWEKRSKGGQRPSAGRFLLWESLGSLVPSTEPQVNASEYLKSFCEAAPESLFKYI